MDRVGIWVDSFSDSVWDQYHQITASSHVSSCPDSRMDVDQVRVISSITGEYTSLWSVSRMNMDQDCVRRKPRDHPDQRIPIGTEKEAEYRD